MTRKMGEYDVLQRTSDGYFNATSIVKQWNTTLKNNPHKSRDYKEKDLFEYLDNKSTKEFISTIADRENLNGKGEVVLSKRGKNGGTWVHPMLFIDLCMWINPNFKYDVLKFVQDELIHFRNLTGDNYPVLTASLAKLPNPEYKDVARGMNMVVFGEHYKNIRNKATVEQLRELDSIQNNIAFAIDMGFAKNQEHVMAMLRRMYHNKYHQ